MAAKRLIDLDEFALTRNGLWLPPTPAAKPSRLAHAAAAATETEGHTIDLITSGHEPVSRVSRGLFDQIAGALHSSDGQCGGEYTAPTWQRGCMNLVSTCVAHCGRQHAGLVAGSMAGSMAGSRSAAASGDSDGRGSGALCCVIARCCSNDTYGVT